MKEMKFDTVEAANAWLKLNLHKGKIAFITGISGMDGANLSEYLSLIHISEPTRPY